MELGFWAIVAVLAAAAGLAEYRLRWKKREQKRTAQEVIDALTDPPPKDYVIRVTGPGDKIIRGLHINTQKDGKTPQRARCHSCGEPVPNRIYRSGGSWECPCGRAKLKLGPLSESKKSFFVWPKPFGR